LTLPAGGAEQATNYAGGAVPPPFPALIAPSLGSTTDVVGVAPSGAREDECQKIDEQRRVITNLLLELDSA
ncbi:unnamed protein product, partial [Amoebophrya sp. A25]